MLWFWDLFNINEVGPEGMGLQPNKTLVLTLMPQLLCWPAGLDTAALFGGEGTEEVLKNVLLQWLGTEMTHELV